MKHVKAGQPSGVCAISPKKDSIGPPSEEIKAELMKRATKHFQLTSAEGFYFQYWTPPLSPKSEAYQTLPNQLIVSKIILYLLLENGYP
ncbi:MAG: hypothetical protein K1000chlam2_00162 [Chlamydiae bacterium]|nr:hypothetical protein [Chlamydiota bacterium]